MGSGAEDILDDDPGDDCEKGCTYGDTGEPFRFLIAPVGTEERASDTELDDLHKHRRSDEEFGHFQRCPNADDTQRRDDQAAESANQGSLPCPPWFDHVEEPREGSHTDRQTQIRDGDSTEEDRIGEKARLSTLFEQTREQPSVEEEVHTDSQQPRDQ